MKLIGGLILMMGIIIVIFSIFSEKIISFNDTNMTNKRITILGYGTFISLLGIFITFYKEFNGR